MAKKFIGTIFGLLLVVGTLVGVKVLQFKTMFAQSAHAAAPPETVAVSPVRRDTLRATLDAVGSVTAAQGVTLKAEMPGTIRRIGFESGSLAKAGDILIELESATEKAQLDSAEANKELVRINLEAARALVGSGAISQNQFITLQAQAKQAEAESSRSRAVINKKTIRAPFSGFLGMRLVNLGQFVGNGDPLVSLQALDPIYVDFTLPQQRLAELKVGAPVSVTTDVFPETQFEGKLTAIQSDVDVATRSVRLRATLNNPQGQLRPGLFARVEVGLPSTEQVLLVPVTAVAYATYGDSVYVVEKSEDGKGQVARQKFVRLGQARGDFVVVTKGLSADESVVTTGTFKLRNGAAVVINNELKPEASDKPNPSDT